MKHTGLHLARRDSPLLGVQDELAPLGATELAWPDEEEGRELHRTAGDEASFVRIDVPEQLPDLPWVRQRRAVLGAPRRQCPSQVTAGVALGEAAGHGMPEHLAAVLLYAVRRFDGAALRHALEDLQQFWRLDGGNGPGTDPGRDIPLQPSDDLLAVGRRPRGLALRLPLARHHLERPGDGLPGGHQLLDLVPAPLGFAALLARGAGIRPYLTSRRASSAFCRASLSDTSG